MITPTEYCAKYKKNYQVCMRYIKHITDNPESNHQTKMKWLVDVVKIQKISGIYLLTIKE